MQVRAICNGDAGESLSVARKFVQKLVADMWPRCTSVSTCGIVPYVTEVFSNPCSSVCKLVSSHSFFLGQPLKSGLRQKLQCGAGLN